MPDDVHRFPPIEPQASGLLEVGDGNAVYWEEFGDPAGKAALVVHGGPGTGRSGYFRRSFDPDRYRWIEFDQRGCGLSTPHAADPAVDMAANTTGHLDADPGLCPAAPGPRLGNPPGRRHHDAALGGRLAGLGPAALSSRGIRVLPRPRTAREQWCRTGRRVQPPAERPGSVSPGERRRRMV